MKISMMVFAFLFAFATQASAETLNGVYDGKVEGQENDPQTERCYLILSNLEYDGKVPTIFANGFKLVGDSLLKRSGDTVYHCNSLSGTWTSPQFGGEVKLNVYLNADCTAPVSYSFKSKGDQKYPDNYTCSDLVRR